MQPRLPGARAWGKVTSWPFLVALVAIVAGVEAATHAIGRRPFPPDTTPDGAYARVALAIAQRHPEDAFAYLETEAQWAAFTIHDARKKACERVRISYPPDARDKTLAAWSVESTAGGGPETFARIAERRGWIARLERDLSGAAHVDVNGPRATVVTARGTRYSFRRRDNGIWGLTLFTAELQAEAERASRDLEMVERAAEDYERAKTVTSP